MTSDDLARKLAERCRAAGFDLAAPLQVGWYNDVVEPRLRLYDFDNPQSLAILIGNTRALWPHLLDRLRADPRLLADPNPVDTYSMQRVREAAACLDVDYEIRWAHATTPHPVAIQRLAHVAGLAWLAPSNLSVHPIYGPWIALRAVLVVDAPGPPQSPPVIKSPCDDCEHACLAAFRRALADPGDWRHWLSIRDACPTGRAHRYDELQLAYHYTKDSGALQQALDRWTGGTPPI